MITTDFSSLLNAAAAPGAKGLPPVDQWNPPFCGDIAIRIARDGSWYHEGRPFQRPALVRLLSSILKREGDQYFLVSPVEKMRIVVEDVPFLAVEVAEEPGSDPAALLFRTQADDIVRLDAQHPLRVLVDPASGEPRPYIHVRGGMEARIHRPVFYQLVERAREAIIDGAQHLVLESAGHTFDLGSC